MTLLLDPAVLIAEPRPSRNKQERLLVGQEQRKYLLQIPRSYQDGTAVPLLIVLHGGGGSATDMQKLTRFNNLSAEEGFIVVYPEGEQERWNDGRIPDAQARGSVDDVQFIAHLTATLSASFTIDQHRIYAVGYSNGGAMVLRLACELPGLFAGIATVAASFPRPLANHCEPLQPISVVMIHGTNDTTIPWNGGDANTQSEQFGLFLPVEETAKFWAKRDNCTGQTQVRRLRDLDIKAGYFVDEHRFLSCRPNTEVILYAIVGGGHSWPMPVTGPLTDLLIQRTLGKKLKDLDATRLLWDFLSRQRRPDKNFSH